MTEHPGKSRRAKIWRRTWVGASIAAVVAALLVATMPERGARFVLVLGGIASLACVLEIRRMGFPRPGVDVRPLAVAVIAVQIAAWALWSASSEAKLPEFNGNARFWWGMLALPVVGLGFALLAGLPGLGTERGRVTYSPAYLFLVLWIAVPFNELFLVRLHAGTAGLVALVLLSKVGDIAGYYFGNLLGVTHPFPKLSPGKTTAGCVASLVAGTLVGLACQMGGLLPTPRFGMLSGLLLGAIVNVFSQAGDLAESAVKRRAGVKDSGSLFGPSGGVLDLVDSLLFSIPAALLVWPLLYVWPLAPEGGL